MEKIFLVIVIPFCAILNVQAQLKTISKDSLSSGAVFTKAKIDTQLIVKSSKQNLITDSLEKNKPNKRYYEVTTQFVVSKISDSSFVKVEVNTKFTEDAERWKQYLMNNLNARTHSNNRAKPGTYQVIVRYIESKDGYPSDINALTNSEYDMEAEVVRLIKKGPRWIPATQNGSIVRPYTK